MQVEPIKLKKAAGSRDDAVLHNAGVLIGLFTNSHWGCRNCPECRARMPVLEEVFGDIDDTADRPEFCYPCYILKKTTLEESKTGGAAKAKIAVLNNHDRTALAILGMRDVIIEWASFRLACSAAVPPPAPHTYASLTHLRAPPN